MSSLLHRAAAIIRTIGARPGTTFGVRELAAMLDLPPASCSRILLQMSRLGWVDRDGVRGGFRLGQALYALVDGGQSTTAFPHERLDELTSFAIRHTATVLIVALRGTNRLVLYSISASASTPVVRNEDQFVYSTASGRLLLALQSPAERRRLVRRLGIPTRMTWPGILNTRELHAELRAIRREGLVSHQQGVYAAAAVPLPDDGLRPVALAAFTLVPGAAHTALRDGLLLIASRFPAQSQGVTPR